MKQNNHAREKIILKTSYLGIGMNLLLVAVKIFVGWTTSSIAIILDAVNNATDAISSVVTIIGAKIASKPADKQHPYGHGRVEYMSAAVIGAIIGYAGVTAFWEAMQKIFAPVEATYTPIALALIVFGILVKFFFGRFVKKNGQLVDSQSLIASSQDAIMDAILSSATLLAALANYYWDWRIEGYLGAVIAIMILRTAWEVWHEAISSITGPRAQTDLVEKVRSTIGSFAQVEGTYDLNLHDYGPNKFIATAHIQVSDDLTAKQIHILSHHIERDVYANYGIVLTLGIYAANRQGEAGKIKKALQKILKRHPEVLQMHGFYFDEAQKHVYFDLIIDYAAGDPQPIRDQIMADLQASYPDYQLTVVLDSDISEP